MKKLLEKKIVLITGGSGGIGAQCALSFAEEGAEAVYIVDMNEESARQVIAKMRPAGRGFFLKADVVKENEVAAVFERIGGEYGRLDVLVNVAGICSTNTLLIETMKNWDRMMDINLKGSFLFMREAYKLMQPRGYGRILSISSISGQVGGIRTSPAYAASKAGILSITKSFAKLGAREGITVNAIAPGLIDTEMTRSPGFHYSLEEIPMGRVGLTSEVADTALFLASDLSSYVTGQCINVNGGMYFG